MNTNPLIVADGCDGPKQSLEKVKSRVGELIDSGVYDWGGPADDASDRGEFPAILRAGSEAYVRAVRGALDTEERARVEYWTILKQAVEQFKAREKPPGTDEQFLARYKLGIGIGPCLKGGTEMERIDTFGMALWRVGKLLALLDGDPSTSRFLYDGRDERKTPIIEERRGGVYAVRCELHF